jgi:hypothetical protein
MKRLLNHPPPPFSGNKLSATHRKTEKERQVADRRGEKGVGEEPKHTTPGKLGLL